MPCFYHTNNSVGAVLTALTVTVSVVLVTCAPLALGHDGCFYREFNQDEVCFPAVPSTCSDQNYTMCYYELPDCQGTVSCTSLKITEGCQPTDGFHIGSRSMSWVAPKPPSECRDYYFPESCVLCDDVPDDCMVLSKEYHRYVSVVTPSVTLSATGSHHINSTNLFSQVRAGDTVMNDVVTDVTRQYGDVCSVLCPRWNLSAEKQYPFFSARSYIGAFLKWWNK
jgi:hypothetical protein